MTTPIEKKTMPINGINPSPAAMRPQTTRVEVVSSEEAMLHKLTQSDRELDFDPAQRPRYQEELVGASGWLTTGWLCDASLPEPGSHKFGPVLLLRDSATHPDGVDLLEHNLGLDGQAEVLGKRITEGGANSYYLRLGKDFYTLCVESGVSESSPHAGRYEIYVSEPSTWSDFIDELTL